VTVAVIFGLAVAGGATWLSQDYSLTGNRTLNRRLTGGLLAASAVVLLSALVYIVAIRP